MSSFDQVLSNSGRATITTTSTTTATSTVATSYQASLVGTTLASAHVLGNLKPTGTRGDFALTAPLPANWNTYVAVQINVPTDSGSNLIGTIGRSG